MAIVWAGNEIDAFDWVDPINSVASNTTAGARDSNFIPTGTIQPSANAELRVKFPAMTDLWFHCEFYTGSVGAGSTMPNIMFMDSTDGRVWAQFDCDGSTTTWNMEYWNGAAYVEMTSDDTLASSTKYVLDFYIRFNNSDGAFRYYRDGVLKQSVGPTDTIPSGSPAIDTIIISGHGGGSVGFSQMIVADQMTIGMHVGTLYPTGAGTYSQWTAGVFGDIDDPVVNSERHAQAPTFAHCLDSVSTPAYQSFAMANPAAGANLYEPLAVVLGCRAWRHGTGPDLSLGNYAGGAVQVWSINDEGVETVQANPTQSTKGFWAIKHVEPSTNRPWTSTSLAALEAVLIAQTP